MATFDCCSILTSVKSALGYFHFHRDESFQIANCLSSWNPKLWTVFLTLVIALDSVMVIVYRLIIRLCEKEKFVGFIGSMIDF